MKEEIKKECYRQARAALQKKAESLNYNFAWHWQKMSQILQKQHNKLKQKAKEACEEDMKRPGERNRCTKNNTKERQWGCR